MLDYYEKRLPEYEAIYHKPERQSDLAWLEHYLKGMTRNQAVFELACGTGYWSRRMVDSAKRLHMTDASAKLAQEALSSCRTEPDPRADLTCGVVDAFNLPSASEYDVIVCGFFYSHVLREQLSTFLQGLSAAARPGTRIVLFDNRYVEGSSTPLSRTDQAGNTYQLRQLADGSEQEVLKNFPRRQDLEASLADTFCDITIEERHYFWVASALVPVP